MRKPCQPAFQSHNNQAATAPVVTSRRTTTSTWAAGGATPAEIQAESGTAHAAAHETAAMTANAAPHRGPRRATLHRAQAAPSASRGMRAPTAARLDVDDSGDQARHGDCGEHDAAQNSACARLPDQPCEPKEPRQDDPEMLDGLRTLT